MSLVSKQSVIPGPKSRLLNERRERAVARGVGVAFPLFIHRGEGGLVEDVDGNVFIDFAGGIATLNVGYSSPTVTRAVQEQAVRFLHTCFSVTMYESYVELAERLAALTPGDFPKKAAFFNSGAEGIENAVKIARRYTGRSGILVFDNAFHGRTLLTMTMTGKVKPYKLGFGPFAPEVYRVPFSYCYRCPFGRERTECGVQCLEQIDYFLTTRVDPADLAAIVLEPVQGEGGFIVADREFYQGLQKLCRQHGILLVADEIQSGFGRTGEMFASEHYDVIPDLFVVGKSLAAGLPLSGVVGHAEVMDAPQVGGLGGTYVGNPVACSAALAVLDVYEQEGLLTRGRELGQKLWDRLGGFQEKYPTIGEVRGLGPMIAMEFVRDRTSKEPDPEVVKRVLAEALRQGLLLLKAGVYDNVIRVMVPLVVTDEQLEQGLNLMDEALAAATSPQGQN